MSNTQKKKQYKLTGGMPVEVPKDVSNFNQMKTNSQPASSNGATIFIVVMVVIVVGFIGFLMLSNSGNTQASSTVPNTTAATTVNGQQIINMTAKATGYTPSVIQAKANSDTILRVDATNDFGCTSGIRIPQLGISKNMSGVTDIALGTQAPGTTINGTCSMGMYNFQIKFS